MRPVVSKLHGLGNDFLVYDLAQGDPGGDWAGRARRWCDRTTGIGADGLLLLGWQGPTRLTMRLHNSDGSSAEMSGNGIRCLVHAAHAKSTNPVGTTYDILTPAGPRAVRVTEGGRDRLETSVDMGTVTDLAEPPGWAALGCNPDRPVRHVSLGNPHSVVGVESVAEVDLAALGALVPQVNLEVVEPGPGPGEVTMRVHERGAGITLACGTGACAAADAAYAWGLVPRSVPEVTVRMDGGCARVAVSPDRRATLTGPSEFVADHPVDV